MKIRLLLGVCIVAAPLFAAGCFGIGKAVGTRSGAIAADHYIKYYAEPEAAEAYSDDPQEQKEFRKQSKQARRDLRDTIVQ